MSQKSRAVGSPRDYRLELEVVMSHPMEVELSFRFSAREFVLNHSPAPKNCLLNFVGNC